MDLVARDESVGFADRFSAQLESGWHPREAELLLANKAGKGLRPLTVLPLEERVVLRALRDALGEHGLSDNRDRDAYVRMERGPVDAQGVEFVVEADVAAFYDYVDHEVLAHELVALTGDAELAQQVRKVLGSVLDRDFGLPQVHVGSDLLSELVIDKVDRALRRAGVPVWRFNDDFRLGAATEADAQQAIELLHHECRRIGLTVNDDKTFRRPQAEYQRVVGQFAATWQTIVDEVDADLSGSEFDVDFDEIYDDVAAWEQPDDEPQQDAIDEDESEAQAEQRRVETALRALNYWHERMTAPDVSPSEKVALRRLLLRATTYLWGAGHPIPGPTARLILERAPLYTRQVVRVASRATAEDVEPLLEDILQRHLDGTLTLSSWQQLWLSHIPRVHRLASRPVPQRWLQQLAARQQPLIAAAADFALAQEGLGDPQALARKFTTAGTIERPELLAAIHMLEPASDLGQSILRDDPYGDLIGQWARQRRSVTDP